MDKYDKAVEYLTESPGRILQAWKAPRKGQWRAVTQAHCLFQYVTRSGVNDGAGDYYPSCGCMTQIKLGSGFIAETPELTQAIHDDDRIPSDEDSITVADLPVFAEWQRRIDKELGR